MKPFRKMCKWVRNWISTELAPRTVTRITWDDKGEVVRNLLTHGSQQTTAGVLHAPHPQSGRGSCSRAAECRNRVIEVWGSWCQTDSGEVSPGPTPSNTRESRLSVPAGNEKYRLLLSPVKGRRYLVYTVAITHVLFCWPFPPRGWLFLCVFATLHCLTSSYFPFSLVFFSHARRGNSVLGKGVDS